MGTSGRPNYSDQMNQVSINTFERILLGPLNLLLYNVPSPILIGKTIADRLPSLKVSSSIGREENSLFSQTFGRAI